MSDHQLTSPPARRLVKWLVVLAVGALILVLPKPTVVPVAGWRLLAIFMATMTGLVVQPVPAGAMVFLGVCALAASGIVPVAQALAGYGDPVVWLVLSAFFISRAMIKTGLGRRIALHFVRFLGGTTLGVGYALVLSDSILGMIIPSNGARSGGVIFPIGKSVAETYDSHPGVSARRLGSFMMLLLYNADVVICAMFLTGQASNAFIAKFAHDSAHVELTYVTWLVGALVPGIIALALVPLVIYRIHRPEITHTPAAREVAENDLGRLGRVSRDERIMAMVFAGVLLLWMTKAWHPIDYVAVAMLGVTALLLTNVLTWDDVVTERNAWDVFFWYGGLVQLAKLLGDSGVTKWFAGYTASHIAGWQWWSAIIVLSLVYFYVHYGFASITAHAAAMYVPFLTVCIAAGAPPLFTVLLLAYLSNLSASLTHYGTTPAPIYFGAGYVTQREWWRVGFIVSVVNLLIWGSIGPLWWKVLGWW